MAQHTLIYPGTFDPITNGHIDLAERATRLFDHVIVAVATNTKKNALFSLTERIALARHVFAENKKIVVDGFSDKLLIDYVDEQGGSAILRGIRAVSDFEAEFQMAAMNRSLAGHIETIFMSPAESLSYISSSLVKEIAAVGGDTTHFVPDTITRALQEKFAVTKSR